VTDVDAEERELLRGLLGVELGQPRIAKGTHFQPDSETLLEITGLFMCSSERDKHILQMRSIFCNTWYVVYLTPRTLRIATLPNPETHPIPYRREAIHDINSKRKTASSQ